MKNKKLLRPLTIYLVIVQSLHLLTLLRAGIILRQTGEMPFPAPPPASGWEAQTIPFFLGMGFLDGVAIIIALVFAHQALFRGEIRQRLGLFSLTIAGTSAIVFAVGTLASGAWAAHPLAYGLMVVLFTPFGILYLLLMKSGE
ncbi:MAG: hypothetical protein MAG431_01506 [Chloroflexi bacterium]|nr:hypothetical protein [Chloroflexota bacterium]